ncbi:MAG: glutathione peroxidase [Bacteroidota bacterium]|nr:glutathione peroxidase [Bacteroidota bacterium]
MRIKSLLMKVIIMVSIPALFIAAKDKLFGVPNMDKSELAEKVTKLPKSIYDYTYTDIDGKEVKLSQYKGKKILFVNVASECGFTNQYEALEAVYEKYKGNLVILGFPCNQFGGQEPGTEQEVKAFCSSKFHVTFPMTNKIDVKGKNQHPIYTWLTSKALNGVEDAEVGWNFNKFLIDENGKYVSYYSSRVKPDDASIVGKL